MNYALRDFEIIPSQISTISHRGDINIRYKTGETPFFVSPMSCITDPVSFESFTKAGFTPIMPRNINFDLRIHYLAMFDWAAFSIDETYKVIDIIKEDKILHRNTPYKICIDISSGNMADMFSVVDSLHIADRKVIIMAGNIANEYTYYEYAMHGIDYVRCGIGGGSVCSTSRGSGCHKSMGSLIADTYKVKLSVIEDIDHGQTIYKSIPKIIADGGINDFDKVNIALALGADYVMMGEMIAKTSEACCDERIDNIPDYEAVFSSVMSTVPMKAIHRHKYYGMSTQIAQQEYNNGKPLKHSEGTVKWVDVEWTAQELMDELTHWLREAMSMCDCKSIEDFVGLVRVELRSRTEFADYDKPIMLL